MEAAPLPLFEFNNITSEIKISSNSEPVVDKLVTPITQVLEHITPKSENLTSSKLTESPTFKKSLDDLFPEQAYEDKDIQKAKELLGEVVDGFSDEQLRGTVIEIQAMAQSWMDAFERSIFRGLTLKEVLHEKGSI